MGRELHEGRVALVKGSDLTATVRIETSGRSAIAEELDTATLGIVGHSARVKRVVGFSLLLAWCAGQPAERPVTSPLPTCEIRRATEPITVDGRLDERSWKEVATLMLQFPREEQTGAKQTTGQLVFAK